MTTVMTVKNKRHPEGVIELRAEGARRALDVATLLEQPVRVVGRPCAASRDELPCRRVEAGVLLEGHDNRLEQREDDDDSEQDERRRDKQRGGAALAGVQALSELGWGSLARPVRCGVSNG